MIPAPREVFEVIWNGAAWRAPAPPPASAPAPPVIRFRRTRRQVLAARNRAPHTRAAAKRRLWAALASPCDVDTLARLSGLTRAAAGAWMSKGIRARVIVRAGRRGRRVLYMRAPDRRHAINFPPIGRAALAGSRAAKGTR